MTFGQPMPSKLWREIEGGTWHMTAVWFTTADEAISIRRRGLFKRAMKILTDIEAA